MWKMDPDDMEIDYTHPVQSTAFSNSLHFPIQSNQSFFNRNQLKSGFENNVTDLFGKIQLSEQQEQQQQQQQKEAEQNINSLEQEQTTTNSIVPYYSTPPPSSPPALSNSPLLSSCNSSPAIIQSSSSLSSETDQPNEDTLQVNHHSIPSTITKNDDDRYIVHHYTHDYLNQSHGSIHFISGLVKITFVGSIALLIVYLVAYFVTSLKHDVGSKIAGYESDSIQEIFYCQQQYEMNQCDPDRRLPGIAELCKDWERCMYRPVTVSHTKAIAEIMGDVANGFVETITIKTLVVSMAAVWSFLYVWSKRT